MKSSDRIAREAPVEVVRGVWVVLTSAAQVHSRLVAVEDHNLTRLSVHRFIHAIFLGGTETILRDMSSWRWCRIRIVLRCWCGRVSSCSAVCGEVLLLAAVLAHARLVPIRLITSPMLLSPLMRLSASVLTLGGGSHPADPGIGLLILRMSPLLGLRISPLLLLPSGPLLLMVL